MFDEQNATFFVTTSAGLEQELIGEIIELAEDLKVRLAESPKLGSAGVYVRAPWTFAIAMNFALRCASRILCEIFEGEVRNAEDVYEQVEKLNWPEFFPLGKTFVVQSTSAELNMKAPALNLKIKDAIADSFRRRTQERPSVDKDAPDVRIMARLHRGRLSVSIDTTGVPLSMRGYRVAGSDAPMSELLAAGLIRMTGWNVLCREMRSHDPQKVYYSRLQSASETPSSKKVKFEKEGDADAQSQRRIPAEIPLAPELIDPMCGSGTLAIEAALQLLNRRPQIERKNFAYLSLSLFPEQALKQVNAIRRDLRAQELSLHDALERIGQYREGVLGRKRQSGLPEAPIVCRDADQSVVTAARRNAEAAGVTKLLNFSTGPVAQMKTHAPEGLIVMNPPYGVRLGDEESLKPVYKSVGDTLKQNCRGWQAWILAGSDTLAKSIGLRATRRRKVFNGGIECVWLQYVLF